ncbi:MAG: PilZ domain-containing protein [Magnetococcales bacterium]|nr:PilZ domain-containing protein [Magnetococcales bacterium]
MVGLELGFVLSKGMVMVMVNLFSKNPVWASKMGEKFGRSKQPVNNRRHERYGMRFPVTLHFEDGEVVRGFSEDVSLSGFFVVTPYTETMVLDRLGAGTIQLGQDSYTFQCCVSRLTPTGIGVTLNQGYAMLGLAIANYVYKEISTFSLKR